MLQEISERTLRQFVRGGTWPGLAREIAWRAVRATESDYARLNALTSLVEAKLAHALDSLDDAVERVCVAAAEDHLRNWPHDREGAETIAVLEGQEEAIQVLSCVYVDVLEWTIGVIRPDQPRNGRPGSGRLGSRRSDAKVSTSDLPAPVSQWLTTRFVDYGWPRRGAA
jgi:hypothetical protein